MTANTLSEIVGVDLDVDEVIEHADPDRCAHIVKRYDKDIGAEAVILHAALNGIEVEALCGHRWVPSGLAPDHLIPCRHCIRRWEEIA